MPKMEPHAQRTIEVAPIDRRPESQVVPERSPLPTHGPTTDRANERLAILSLLRNRQTDPQNEPIPSSCPQEPSVPKPDGVAALPNATSEITTQPDGAKAGFFATLKERFLALTGLNKREAEATQDAIEPKQGVWSELKNHFGKLSEVRSFSDLAAWAIRLVSIPFSNHRQPGAQKPRGPAPAPIREEPKTPVETTTRSPSFVAAEADPRPAKIIKFDLEQSNTPRTDYTAQALHTVAEATRKEEIKAQKIKETTAESEQRAKDSIHESIHKLKTDGMSKDDLAAILHELDGVYGAADVAQRQIHELITRRKASIG